MDVLYRLLPRHACIGMGELHLEIVFNRLRREFGLQPYQGPVQVAYRERPVEAGSITHTMERTLTGKPQVVVYFVSAFTG